MPFLLRRINHAIHLRAFGFFLRQDFIFRFTNLYKQQTSALKILHGFTDKIIQERRQKLITQKTDTNMSDESVRDKGTFLDILLRGTIDGKPLSNLDIREEVDTFMFEVCFHHKARYPFIQHNSNRDTIRRHHA